MPAMQWLFGGDAPMWDRGTIEYVGVVVGIVAAIIGIVGGIIAILAAIRVIFLWFRNRKPHPAISICIHENFAGNPAVLFAKIINNSEADLNLVESVEFVVDDPQYQITEPKALHHYKAGAGYTDFPGPLRKNGRVIVYESMSQLADDLRMRDCWESCLVRVAFRDSYGNPLVGPRYVFPVKHWLAFDATALGYTPTGPQTTDVISGVRAWWAQRRARTMYACPRWG
jgi:hypothetical protein